MFKDTIRGDNTIKQVGAIKSAACTFSMVFRICRCNIFNNNILYLPLVLARSYRAQDTHKGSQSVKYLQKRCFFPKFILCMYSNDKKIEGAGEYWCDRR